MCSGPEHLNKKYKIFQYLGRSRLYQRCLFYSILTYSSFAYDFYTPFAYVFKLVGPDTILICLLIF
jgi:hypothetical protein